MLTYIPYPVQGEILSVNEKTEKEKNVVRYTCRVFTREGSEIYLTNVEDASSLGGIDDYERYRSRARSDAEFPNSNYEKNNLDASVGDRVIIVFLEGNILRPQIIAHMQHPNQTDEEMLKKPSDSDPVWVKQHLGLRQTLDKDGQFRIVHKKAPKITFKPKAGGGLLGSAIGAVSGALSSATSSVSEKIVGKSNPAVSSPEEDEITLLEFLNKGIFRIRDSKGGMFELDHNKDRVYISNNDLKSIEDPEGGPLSGGLQMASNSTDAEYVLLDRKKELVLINARKIAQIYSFDKRKDVTEGNHSHKIGGDSSWIISGNNSVEISGSEDMVIKEDRTTEISGECYLYVKKEMTTEVDGDTMFYCAKNFDIKCDKDFCIIASGKIAIGNSSAELLQLLDDTLTAIQALTVGTGVGPSSPPINLADFSKIQQKLALIKGSL